MLFWGVAYMIIFTPGALGYEWDKNCTKLDFSQMIAKYDPNQNPRSLHDSPLWHFCNPRWRQASTLNTSIMIISPFTHRINNLQS